MDINLPSELTSPISSANAGGDLLAQLRAAGTIEAEVIQVLKDNLLLRSRLGEILTRNTLNYKTGDRITLRLDERGPAPVLKSSPAESRPVAIEARGNPELAALLTPGRPALAKVLRVVAQQAEVRLAQAVVKLPPQVSAKRGDLLRLLRDDGRQQIEITPLQAKAIYKALIKQLAPATRDNGPASLVRLFDLLARAAGEMQPRASGADAPVRQQLSAQAATPPAASPGRAAGNPVNATPGPKSGIENPVRPNPDSEAPIQQTRNPARTANASARLAAAPAPPPPAGSRTPAPKTETATPAPAPKSPASTPAERSAAIPRPLAGSGGESSRGQTGEVAAPATRTAAIRPPETAAPAAAKASPGTSARGALAGSKPASADAAPAPRDLAQPPSSTPPKPPSAGQVEPAPTPASRANPLAARTLSAAQIGKSNSPPPATPAAGAQNPANSKPPAVAIDRLFDRILASPDDRGEPAAPLKLLTRLLPRLPQLDAASLQRWFQAAKLVDTAGTQSSPSMDLMRILTRLGDADGFARELGNLVAAEARTRAEAEAQSARFPPEAPGPQIREGLKLVEQSLAQNLLQRATIGLQQETQQPLAFNLALPLLEQNEIKPLYIDLAQRKRAQKQSDQCWDIRIRFEFSALGPVCCHIVLEGSAVAASFYSERAATRANIDAALPELRRQLIDAGFDAGEFHSFSGGFKIDQSPLAAAVGEALIDIEV